MDENMPVNTKPPNGRSGNGKRQNGDKTMPWSAVYKQGEPMSVTKLLFLASLVTVVVKYGLSEFEVFSFFKDTSIVLVYASIALLIYLSDLVVRAYGRTKSWYADHPIKDWYAYPQRDFEWIYLVGAIIIIVLLLVNSAGNTVAGFFSEGPLGWLFGSSQTSQSQANSASAEGSSSTTSSTQSREAVTLKLTSAFAQDGVMPPGDVFVTAAGEDLKIQWPTGDFMRLDFQSLVNHCLKDGYRHEFCALLSDFLLYWKEVTDIKTRGGKTAVTYEIKTDVRCFDCGLLTTGEHRYPKVCNSWGPSALGKHPLTGKFVSDEYRCDVQPPSLWVRASDRRFERP